MEKYKININIELEAKDFVNAEKVKGKIVRCILPILLREEFVDSWEAILQKKGRERL